uniref:Uncharacterized protein n=1 Tax=Picea glauca TaxID=3330 RepID=A0A101M568_PICGL|nr:hypothetical protein ABT39_MTgene1051 [Picea glauca]
MPLLPSLLLLNLEWKLALMLAFQLAITLEEMLGPWNGNRKECGARYYNLCLLCLYPLPPPLSLLLLVWSFTLPPLMVVGLFCSL